MKYVTILGSTGSIGQSTLSVLALHKDEYAVFALTAHKQKELLAQQCLQFHPRYAVLLDKVAVPALQQQLKISGCVTEVLTEISDLERVASSTEVDVVMAAIVGIAGLASCLAAVKAGKRVLLANKEALVVSGSLLLEAAQQSGAEVVPIDSEHSAIFQALPLERSRWKQEVSHLTLTASGGPFLGRIFSTLSAVTPEQAIKHPRWDMGRKISVDSATMMNKALEIIEAAYLFGFSHQHIKVVIHPQSIVHGSVSFHDASMIAQLGVPDMRSAIAYGFAYPNRIQSGVQHLELVELCNFEFFPVDEAQFPCLQLARCALDLGQGACVALNAANEVAVETFLSRQILYTDIYHINAAVIDRMCTLSALTPSISSLEELLNIDQEAMAYAKSQINQLKR